MKPVAKTFWTPHRTKRLTNSALLSIFISVLLVCLSGNAEKSLLFRGDFPAFYVAANLAASSRLDEIYQPDVQHKLQESFWPSLESKYFAFSYPPYVAQLLAPLGTMSPTAAKLLYSLLMFISLALGIKLLERVLPSLSENYLATLTGFITFAPAFVGLFGGQNTALSLLLVSFTAWSLSRNRPKADFLAGLALGLWLFKPNFALFVILGVAVFARVPFFLGVIIPAVCYYTVSAVALGMSWPTWWYEQVALFSAQENSVNGFQMISLWYFRSVLVELSGDNLPLAIGAQIALALVICFVLWRSYQKALTARREDTSEARLDAFFAFLPAALLLSPHTMFYELTWLLPSFVYFYPPRSDRRVWIYLALSCFAAALLLLRESFVINPLYGFPFAALLLANTSNTTKKDPSIRV